MFHQVPSRFRHVADQALDVPFIRNQDENRMHGVTGLQRIQTADGRVVGGVAGQSPDRVCGVKQDASVAKNLDRLPCIGLPGF